jgi:hypothetical protein
MFVASFLRLVCARRAKNMNRAQKINKELTSEGIAITLDFGQ